MPNVTIRGLPILSGEVLSPVSPVFASLFTPEDFVGFARQLRGQFCILIEDGSRTTAITDFGYSRPVFYLREPDGTGYRVSIQLADLTPFSRKTLSKEALFFFASRNGVGVFPFYSDIRGLYPATVTCFEGDRMESHPYLDWGEFLKTDPIEPADAERRFIEIASGYLGPIARSRGQIGNLLSSGTDSALMAWLLQQIGLDGYSMTADYVWKRYSEFEGSAASASALGVPHRRVLVTAESRSQALLALNSSHHNAPCCHSQAPVMYDLAKYALEHGISTLATGDHADALFLGFDRFFRGFPGNTTGYVQSINSLDTSAKMDRLYSSPHRTTAYTELLSAFDCTEEEFFAWDQRIYSNDTCEMSAWVDRARLDTLQQLTGQIWAGISWQNLFLPVTEAFDNQVEFVSPFYDIEMIRFAMSLPPEYKFRDGATKALLRDIVHRVLGRSIVKRASPNPSRVWRLAPDLAERRRQPAFLLPLYDRCFRRNLLSVGGAFPELDKVGALGTWLAQRPGELNPHAE